METVFGHQAGAKVHNVERAAVGGEGQINRAARACPSANGGIFLLRSGTKKHAAAAGFKLAANHLPAVIFRRRHYPKNLTRAAEGGGSIGDRDFSAAGGKSQIRAGIAKLAFMIDG